MAGAAITKGARELCAAGLRSALAAQSAQRMGLRPVADIAGGYAAWKEAGGSVQEKARR